MAKSLPKPAEHLKRAAKKARRSRAQTRQQSQPQVILRVRVIEISRAKLQELGLDFSRASSEPAQPESLVRVVDALRKVGVARIVAEPEIATLSNQTASLEVGSHARVPVLLGCGKTEIQDEFHGTSVDFTPEVLNDKKIHIKLRIELCHPDKAHPPTGAGEFGAQCSVLRSLFLKATTNPGENARAARRAVFGRDDSPAQAAADGTSPAQAAADHCSRNRVSEPAPWPACKRGKGR